MDQATQQNAAMVEQSTAASHSLAREAEELFRILAPFKTGAEEMQMRRAPAAPPKPATHASRPVASPARAVASRVAQSFRTHGSAAVKEDDWQEF
jgi:methyl-accepting chemotaxis protein